MSDAKPKKDWAHAPVSGSTVRPYRFNCRLDPSERAQLMDILVWIKSDIMRTNDAPLCECLIKAVLALQHLRRHIVWGDKQQKTYARSFFDPLDRSDYLVERGKKLIAHGVLKQHHFEQTVFPFHSN